MVLIVKKGQSGLEFMFLVIFLLLVFSSYYAYIHNNSVDVINHKRNYLATSISEKIAYEINMAVTSGAGYLKQFYVPSNIYGYPYNITFSRKAVFVDWDLNSQASYIVTNNISGTFINGYNYIQNKDGQIYMNPAFTQIPDVIVSYTPTYPKPEDDITLIIRADDTLKGNKNIVLCQISDDGSNWTDISADDGAYDEPIEVSSVNIGNMSSATYTYLVRCDDADTYRGESQVTFKVSAAGSGWWDSSWRYRIAINVTGDDYVRNNYPFKVNINFTQLLSELGDSYDFDNNSIRVVEWDNVIEANIETAANYKEITRMDTYYPDIWDMTADAGTNLIDFTSGLNQSGNTWNVTESDDGWDWSNSSILAPYGHNGAQANYFVKFGDPDGDSDYDTDVGFGVSKPDLPVDSKFIAVIIGNMVDDPNTGEEILDSGAWGIKFYIDSDMYSAISAGGKAYLSFDYYADDLDDDLEEGAWIKARFGNATTMNYLGSDLDTGRAYFDSTNEIWASVDDPNKGWDDLVSGVYEEDVSQYITSEGWYYLDLGGKVDWVDSDSNGHSTNEGLGAYFDNIDFQIKRETSMYDKGQNATVDVYFLLEGDTGIGQTRYYYLYFESENNSKNASTLSMNYDVEYLHIGYYSTNYTKMENLLESMRVEGWISSWLRTNTGTVSPNLDDNDIDTDTNVAIIGQSDSPTINLDSWVNDNNSLILFTSSRGLTTDLPIAGYSSSNHQKYGDLETTIYTKYIEYELSRNSMSYGYIDQGANGVYVQSCVEIDEGDNQAMLSSCDYNRGFISLTNYPSTASEATAYPSAKEEILKRYLWMLLFERSNRPAVSVAGDAEIYTG